MINSIQPNQANGYFKEVKHEHLIKFGIDDTYHMSQEIAGKVNGENIQNSHLSQLNNIKNTGIDTNTIIIYKKNNEGIYIIFFACSKTGELLFQNPTDSSIDVFNPETLTSNSNQPIESVGYWSNSYYYPPITLGLS